MGDDVIPFYELINIPGMEVAGEERFTSIHRSAGVDLAPVVAGLSDISAQLSGIAGGSIAIPDDGGAIGDVSSSIPETVWLAQNAVLDNQNAFLDDLATQYEDRKNKLPETSTDEILKEVLEFVVGEGAAWLLAKWMTKIPIVGEVLEGYIDDIAGFVVSLGFIAYDWLKSMYSAGTQFCNKIADENHALLALEQTRQNYELRSQIIVQHEHSIQNMILIVNATEKQAQEITVQPETDIPEQTTQPAPKVIDFGFLQTIDDGPISSLVD